MNANTVSPKEKKTIAEEGEEEYGEGKENKEKEKKKRNKTKESPFGSPNLERKLVIQMRERQANTESEKMRDKTHCKLPNSIYACIDQASCHD